MSTPALGLIETTSLAGALVATRAATKAARVAIASAERIDVHHFVVKVEGDWTVVQKAVEAGALAADKSGELISMHVIPRTDQDLSSILPYNRFLARYLENAPGATKPKRIPRPRVAKPKPAPAAPKPEPVKPSPPPTLPAPGAFDIDDETWPPDPRPTFNPPAAEPKLELRPESRQVTSPPAPEPEPSPAASAPAATPVSATPTGEPPMSELEALSGVKLRRYARGLRGLTIQGRQISMANKVQLLEAIRDLRSRT
jgi:hypothetical protein